MPVRLAFVDDPARLADVPEGFAVVALDPFVAIAAPDAVPVDAHLDDMEVEALGEQTLERVDAICDALDVAAGAAPESGTPSVTARWRFQELKTVYDGMLTMGLGAVRVARALHADEALLLARPGSLAAAVLPVALESIGVVTRTSAGGAAAVPAAPGPSLGVRVAAARTRVRRMWRPRRPRVLCLDSAYSVPAIAAALRARGADVLLWLPPPRTPRRGRPPDLSGLEPLFQLAGLDLWPAVHDRLRSFVELGLAADDAALCAAEAAVRRDRPDVLLGSVYAAPVAKAAAAAARAAGVPTVAARHGELGTQALPLMVFNDLDVVDWVLCWGAWEARFGEHYGPRPVRAEIVGAPMIEQAAAEAPGRLESRRRLDLGDEETVVLFAPNALSGDAWFAGRRAPLDLGHVRHQVALLEELLSLDGVRVVVKEHPQWAGAGPLDAWARSTGAHAAFVRDRPFAELVHLADALVLDFPSTTLVQALHGSSRLYVVRHPITVWEPGVVEHLERYGVRFVSPPRLAAELRADLEAGVLTTPATYPQEAREPLVASGPGTAAERAADAIVRIAGGDAG